jgi:hypothetical protein
VRREQPDDALALDDQAGGERGEAQEEQPPAAGRG